jgi:hypothetical protein
MLARQRYRSVARIAVEMQAFVIRDTRGYVAGQFSIVAGDALAEIRAPNCRYCRPSWMLKKRRSQRRYRDDGQRRIYFANPIRWGAAPSFGLPEFGAKAMTPRWGDARVWGGGGTVGSYRRLRRDYPLACAARPWVHRTKTAS